MLGGKGEPADGERLDEGSSTARADQFSHDIANARTELEAMAAEAERIVQAIDVATGPHHRQGIGQVTFDAAPHADDVEIADPGSSRRIWSN